VNGTTGGTTPGAPEPGAPERRAPAGLPPRPGRATWIEIDLGALAHNLRVVRAHLSGARVMAVVKADAYGHGAPAIAQRLQREGADWLGVSLVEEGIELRAAGIRLPILVLAGFAPRQAEALLDHHLTPALFRLDQVAALDDAAARRGRTAEAHVKIDTGMGRLGLPASQAGAFAERLKLAHALNITGAFSHFPSADTPGDASTARQTQAFLQAVAAFKAAGLSPSDLHLANSPAILDHRATWMSLARPGLLLYGYHPDGCVKTLAVRPVLSLRSAVVDLRDLQAGDTVGYGRTFKAPGPVRIATLGIGYADGLPRAAGNHAEVLLAGQRAPIVGRISMDLTTVDVTALPQTAIGDVATVIGEQEGVRLGADVLARACGTIPWEILARLGPRLPRRHVGI
jgi:alanine racemase